MLSPQSVPTSPTDSAVADLDYEPCLPTEPMNASQAAQVHQAENEPRLLFRAASTRSRGGPDGNTLSAIDPLHPTVKHPYETDGDYYDKFSSMPWEKANLMINSHLRWVYDRPSGFSSWSSSLLDALMHGCRRRDEKQENVVIYVLDTTLLQGQGRIFSATKLMNVFGQDKQFNGPTYYERAIGEHLVYGRLAADDGFTAVSLESLIEAGLFSVLQSLDTTIRREHDVNKVHKNMQTTRGYYMRKRHTKPPKRTVKGPVLSADGTEFWPFLPHMTRILRAIGQCFGPSWEAILTIAFACTRRRNVFPDSNDFDLAPLLVELDGLGVRWLGNVVVMDSSSHDLREDHVQMLQVWQLLEAYQDGRLNFRSQPVPSDAWVE